MGKSQPKIVVRSGKARINPNRGAELLDRLVQSSGSARERDPQIVPRLNLTRLEPHRDLILIDRIADMAL